MIVMWLGCWTWNCKEDALPICVPVDEEVRGLESEVPMNIDIHKHKRRLGSQAKVRGASEETGT